MPYYFPKKVALKGSVKYLFPSLMTRTTQDVVEIWDYVSLDIRQMLLKKKGIYITGLGTFGVTRQELRVGKDERLPIDRPEFQLSETLRKFNGLGSVKQSVADFVPVVPLEYRKLADETENLQKIFNDCIKETLLCLSRCMSQGLNIDFSFLNMGVLSIRGKKVKMRFYEEFAFSVDVTGNLKEVLTSGKGKVNWVIPQEAPDIPVILPEADILFPSLQLKTERGELLIKSLQKVTDEEEEEEEEEGEVYFQEKSDRKDVLPALVHYAPARKRAVDMKEGLQEEKKRKEPSVRKLPEIQRSSRGEERSKKILKAKPEPLVPESYMKAIEEAAKISTEWDLRNSHLAPDQRKEKKVLADLTAYKVQGARSFIPGAQLTSLAERLQGKKERELNLEAKKAALQKMKAFQESSKPEPIPNQLSAARLGEVPAHTLLKHSATNDLLFMTESGEVHRNALQKRASIEEEEEEEKHGEDYFQEKTNRKVVVFPALVHNAPTRKYNILLKEELQEKNKQRGPSVRRLPEIKRSASEEQQSEETLEAKPKTEIQASKHFMKAVEEIEEIAAQRNLRTSLLASAQRKEKKALAHGPEYETHSTRKNIHEAQVPRSLSIAQLGEIPDSIRVAQRANPFSTRQPGKKEKSQGRQVEQKQQRNTQLLHDPKQSADKTKPHVFLPHPPPKGKSAERLEKSLKQCLLIHRMQVSKALQRSEVPLGDMQESTAKKKDRKTQKQEE